MIRISLGWRAWLGPYAWAIPAALILMLFAFVNTYAVFFIDSRAYVRSAAVATDSILGTGFGDPWLSMVDPREVPFGPDAALAPASSVAAGGRIAGSEAPAIAAPPGGRLTTMVAQPPAQPRAWSEFDAGLDAGVEDGIVNNGITANRSIYYGFVAFLGYVTSDFWLLIAFQGYVTASCMALASLRVLGMRPGPYLGVTALLSLVTCVGPFVAYVMPDIFGATIILGAITLLLGWDRLLVLDRFYLAAIVAFSALAHNSNVLLLASIFGAWLAWTVARGTLRGRLPQVGTMALLLALGPVGLAAFGYMIERQTGEAPLVLPHVTAHLVDLGPGTAYAKYHCEDGEFAVCEFRDILPVSWIAFLGGSREEGRGVFAVADLPTKRRLSDEQMRFALAVLRTYPVETTLGLLGDGARQLGTLSLADMKVDAIAGEYFRRHMPPSVWAGISGSTIYAHPGLLDAITLLTYASSLVGLLYVLWFLYQGRRSRYEGSEVLAGWIALLLVAIIANAAICGILASPMGRFSARLVWLLPFAALLAIFTNRTSVSRSREALPVPQGV